MADEQSKKILSEWNLGEYENDFKKHKITFEILPILDDEMIKTLIPTIGDRALFKLQRKKYFSYNIDPSLKEINNDDRKRNSEEVLSTSSPSKLAHLHGIDNSHQENLCAGSTIISEQFKSVKNLLSESERGKNIILNYNKSKTLYPKDRTFIVDTLISKLRAVTKTAVNKDFETIGINIVNTFPESEVLATYYIPPISIKNSGTPKRSIPSKGKLVNKWRNLCISVKRIEEKENDTRDNVETEDENLTIDFEVQRSIEWLSNNANAIISDTTTKNWRATSEIRLKEFEKSEDKNLTNIFERWTILKQINASILINIDFDFLELSDVNFEKESWDCFYNKINKICQIKYKKDDTAKGLEDLMTLENISTDCKIAIQIQLLSHLIPPKTIFKYKCDNTKKITTWKVTIAESKESMILLVNTIADIQLIKEKKIDFVKKHKQTLQPYIIVVGENFEKLHSFYVILDNYFYSVNSLSEAVDTCFKAFQVFKLNYPIESKHIWLVIQRCYYKFSTDFDEKFSYTEHIIAGIKNDEEATTIDRNFDDE